MTQWHLLSYRLDCNMKDNNHHDLGKFALNKNKTGTWLFDL